LLNASLTNNLDTEKDCSGQQVKLIYKNSNGFYLAGNVLYNSTAPIVHNSIDLLFIGP
jgi:hypothetical protein